MKALVIVRWLLFHMFCWHGIAEQVLLNREHFNKKMVGHTMYSVAGLSLSACVYGCMVREDCQSFNFERDTNVCYFNKADSSTAPESLEPATSGRVLFSDISVWPQTIAKTCTGTKCGPDQLCVPANPAICLSIPETNTPSTESTTVVETNPTPTESTTLAEANPTPTDSTTLAEANPTPTDSTTLAEGNPTLTESTTLAEANPTITESTTLAETNPTPTESTTIADLVTSTLSVTNGRDLGDEQNPSFCAPGTFATGYKIKFDETGVDGDFTGLNSIIVICKGLNSTAQSPALMEIESGTGVYGTWSGTISCVDNFFIVGFNLQVDYPTTAEDDTAANWMNVRCRNLDWADPGYEASFSPPSSARGTVGNWSNICNSGSAVCGIKTWIEPPQGAGDDTALNDVNLYCCNPPASR